MIILLPQTDIDYQLVDSGNGFRLERFGQYILVRPDPQTIWKPKLSEQVWQKFDAKHGLPGRWIKRSKIPDKWVLRYRNISLYCKLTPFKHTGVFPEQTAHWEWLSNIILNAAVSTKKEINILNLFGYTGGATLAAAATGAKVTHVDASHPAISWARENQQLSGLEQKNIRWILDDAVKFCQREIKRGVKYDGIIMDPPIYGHGPKGEKWHFNISFPNLVDLCSQLLSDNPLFVIVNAYAISSSSEMLKNVLADYLPKGQIESGELSLKDQSDRLLSTGIFARWTPR